MFKLDKNFKHTVMETTFKLLHRIMEPTRTSIFQMDSHQWAMETKSKLGY